MYLTIQIHKFKWQVPNRAPTDEEREMIQDIIEFIDRGHRVLKNLRKSPDPIEQANWDEEIRLIVQSFSATPDYGFELRGVVQEILLAHTRLRKHFPFKSCHEFQQWCYELENYIHMSHCFVIVLKQLVDADEYDFMHNPDRLLVLRGFHVCIKRIKDEFLKSIMPSYWLP